MTVHIDPVTLGKIEAFGRRHRRLILARGLCAMLALLLGAMSAIALVDGLVVLPDVARWMLSAGGYALVIFGVWHTCLKRILRPLSRRELARFIEQARPELREDLLSAVELGEDADARDSEAFSRIVQQDVAGRIKDLPMEEALSWRRIGAWLRAAAALVAVCAVLLILPGLQFDRRLLRSLLPMANLERVSRVQIVVLEPDPADSVVPRGDRVVVRVSTTGPQHGAVILETFPQGCPAERLEMTPLEGRRYESAIALGREPLEYRICAGDAVTRRYRLAPRARPEVARFRKTYIAPAYTRRLPTMITEEKGDLEALEGTVAEVIFEANQEIRAGELHWEQGGKTSTVCLESAGPNLLRARLPIASSGTYRVHLVAAETGFENKYSPQYEIRSRPDQRPRVTLEEPAQDLVVSPDEIVTIRGTAQDDVGLSRVAQSVRVNQGEWIEVPLGPEEPPNPLAVSRRWDLGELGVRPGDGLTTRLVAVDLKGNRAESNPVHLTVASQGFDLQSLESLEAKCRVLEGLSALREAAQAAEKNLYESAPAFASASELQREQILLSLRAELGDLARLADAAEARVQDALRRARPGREANDLVLTGILVQRLRAEAIGGARSAIARGSVAVDPSLRRAVEFSSSAEENYRQVVLSERAIALLNDFRDLARDQAFINRQAEEEVKAQDGKVWGRLARRQAVAAGRIRGVEERLREISTRARDARFDTLAQGLVSVRSALERAIVKPDQALLAPSQALQRQAESALVTHVQMEIDLALKAGKARESLAQRAASSCFDIGAVAILQAEGKEFLERGMAACAQLEARASLEEARRDSDAVFVSDASLAARALQGVLKASAAGSIKGVEQAFRILESGHMLVELSQALRDLADRERSDEAACDAVTRHPKDWSWVENRIKAICEEWPRSGMIPEAIQGLGLAWSAPERVAAQQEMAGRLDPGRKPVSATKELEKLASKLQRVVIQIQPQMEEARRALGRLVPTLADRLAELSKEAEKLQQATSGLAEKARQTKSAPLLQESRKLLDEQQSLDRQMQNLADQIRRQANLEDLLTAEGRERARDADDAIAMMSETPPRAEELLGEAPAASKAEEQANALSRASEQQQKMHEALKTLAEHYRNLDLGKPEETRPRLRKAEEASGLKARLDAQYREMERLAELSRQSPEILRKSLEEQVTKNEAARRKLDRLAQGALDRSEDKLREAEAKAEQVERKLQEMAERLSKAQKIAEQARQMSTEKAPKGAQQRLKEGADAVPKDLSKPEQAARNLEEAAKKFQKAAQDFRAVEQQARQPAAQQVQRSEQLAQQARDLAKALREPAPETAQEDMKQAMEQSSQDMERASKHWDRLGRAESAKNLNRLAEEIKGVAQKKIPAAQKPPASSSDSGQAQREAAAARKAVQEQIQALKKARQAASAPSPPKGAETGELSDAAAEFLARALDALEASGSDVPGQTPDEIARAAQAQAQSMRQGRAPSAAPESTRTSHAPGQSTGAAQKAGESGSLPPSDPGRIGDWGKLPPRLAQDLLEARRESVSGEYRNMVETYFKVVAERAREKK